MNIKKKKKKRYFFLFNDVLLLCRKEGPSRYYLRVYITLRAQGVSISPLQTDNYPAKLVTKLQTFIFYFETLENRNTWIGELEGSITGPDKKKALSEKQRKKQENEFKEEINTINQQVAELLKDSQTNDPASIITPIQPKSTPAYVHSHNQPDAFEVDSSDVASSESPVIKKKKKKTAKKRDRNHRKTIEPKTGGNLIGLGKFESLTNTQENPIDPFLYPVNPRNSGVSVNPEFPQIFGNPKTFGNPQGDSLPLNPAVTQPNILLNPFIVPPQVNVSNLNVKNPFLN